VQNNLLIYAVYYDLRTSVAFTRKSQQSTYIKSNYSILFNPPENTRRFGSWRVFCYA